MSRKKSKQRQAVPEEILAEGSGPVGEPAEMAAGAEAAEAESPTDSAEVVDSDEPVIEAAEKEAPKSRGKRGKRGKKAHVKASAKADDSDAESDADAEAVATSPTNDDDAISADSAEASELDAGAMDASSDDGDAVRASSDDGDGDGDAVHASSEDAGAIEASSDDGDAIHASNEDADAMDASTDADDAMHASSGADLIAASSDAEATSSATDGPDGDDVVGEPITDEASVEAALLPGTLSPVQLRHLIEALIFATDKPVTLQRLRQLTRVSDVTRIEQALAELHEDYKDRGIALHQVSGGYQFRTNTAFSTWVQQLIQGRPVRLSRAQLETLAIVAYRQPITRPEIDEIRGVDSSATLRLLLDRSLIRVLGKKEEVGRPTLYGTTKEFLDFFSLGDLRELPTLREYSELTAESRQVMSDRLGVPLDANGEPLEGDDSLGDIDPDAEPAPQDQASIVDSILAEHAAAEAEAEARLETRDVGADLAEAAMSGGSAVAMRDIFSDEPDPDAMMMSGEMSPVGSEARSYVDAIRAGALGGSEPDADDVEVHADALAESTNEASENDLGLHADAEHAIEIDNVEVRADALAESNTEVSAEHVELHADAEQANASEHVELHADAEQANATEYVELHADAEQANATEHVELHADAEQANATEHVELDADADVQEANATEHVELHVDAEQANATEHVELHADVDADADAEQANATEHVELHETENASEIEHVELHADADDEHANAGQTPEPETSPSGDVIDTVGEAPHLAASDEGVAASIEADVISSELAAESSEVAASSTAVEVASEELLAASRDLAAVVTDELAAAELPHVGHVSADDVVADQVESSAHEPSERSVASESHEDDAGSTDSDDSDAN